MEPLKGKRLVLVAIIAAAFVGPIILLVVSIIRDTPEAHLEDYLNRLARVQQRELVELERPSFTTPHRRSLFTPVERLTIGLIESAELRKCDLLEMVYLHNDALGKAQDEFRNFEYQVNVLVGLKRCINQGELSQELTNKLRSIYETKWQQLPSHLRNTLFYATASHKQLYSENWLPVDSKADPQRYRDFSARILLLLEGYKDDELPLNFTIVDFQESLEKQRDTGELYYSLFYANHWLARINLQLTQNSDAIICAQQRSNEQMKTMMNVFSQVYVERLQPYFAHLSQHYVAISPFLTLYDDPILRQHHLYPLEQEYEKFKQQLRVHVDYWTTLRQRCGVSMGQLMSGS